MLYRIIFFCLFCFTLCSEEHVYLKTPNLSREEMIGTSVGIRPYRQTGVRLEAERIKDKLFIHNYGYGSFGLTLALGGSNEVLTLLASQKITPQKVAVLGAGVAGLTTAYDLLEKGYEVHIYSDKWSPDVTSNIAAGSWTPPSFHSEVSNETKQMHQRMLETAEHRFLKSLGSDPEFAGVKVLPCYKLLAEPMQGAATHGDDVVIHFDSGIIKNARRFHRIGLDGKIFMDDLFAKVKNKGAFLHQQRFESVHEIVNLKETVIINCMSFGSRDIFLDQEFIPVRGQLAYFPPQDIDYVIFQGIPDSEYFFFLYPWNDRLILGGVYEQGKEEAVVTPEVIDEILRIADKCLFGTHETTR